MKAQNQAGACQRECLTSLKCQIYDAHLGRGYWHILIITCGSMGGALFGSFVPNLFTIYLPCLSRLRQVNPVLIIARKGWTLSTPYPLSYTLCSTWLGKVQVFSGRRRLGLNTLFSFVIKLLSTVFCLLTSK